MQKQALIGFLIIMLGFWPAFKVASSGTNPISVQLKYFMLPVIDQRGKRRTEAVTIFLHVKKHGYVKSLCRVVPRVRDAVLQVLIADPLHRKGNRIEVNGSRQLVIDHVNHSLGKNAVTGFRVVQGAVSFGKGMAAKLPGAKLGCMRVGKDRAKLNKPR